MSDEVLGPLLDLFWGTKESVQFLKHILLDSRRILAKNIKGRWKISKKYNWMGKVRSGHILDIKSLNIEITRTGEKCQYWDKNLKFKVLFWVVSWHFREL